MSNPRLATLGCERRRGCVFAENFVSLSRLALNDGTVTGAGAVIHYGAALTGDQHIDFDIVESELPATAVVAFSADETSTGILFGNANLISGTSADGFCIWVDDDGVKATYSDGVTIETPLAIDFDYTDGSPHVVVYAFTATGHTLYVDAESDTAVTTTAGPIGAATALLAGGDGADNFVGVIDKVRLFSDELAENEVGFYVDDFARNWRSLAWGIWGCDSWGNDTVGKKILENLNAVKDLQLPDAPAMPAFTAYAPREEHYVFDGVDDCVVAFPAMPDAYLVSLAKSDSYPDGEPEIQQVTDDTVEALLTTPGSFAGNMHSLMVYDGELGTLQKYFLEDLQLAYLRRLDNVDPFSHRLIRDRSCLLWCGYDTVYSGSNDRSFYAQSVANNGATWDEGAEFTTGQYYLVDYDVSQYQSEFVIFVLFDGTPSGIICNWPSRAYVWAKSNTWEFWLGCVTPAIDWPVHTAAFHFKNGETVKVYHDGEYVTESNTARSVYSGAVTPDLYIGNTSTGLTPWLAKLRRFVFCKGLLTPAEIRTLHDQTVRDWL